MKKKTNLQINKRADNVDEKIRKLDILNSLGTKNRPRRHNLVRLKKLSRLEQ